MWCYNVKGTQCSGENSTNSLRTFGRKKGKVWLVGGERRGDEWKRENQITVENVPVITEALRQLSWVKQIGVKVLSDFFYDERLAKRVVWRTCIWFLWHLWQALQYFFCYFCFKCSLKYVGVIRDALHSDESVRQRKREGRGCRQGRKFHFPLGGNNKQKYFPRAVSEGDAKDATKSTVLEFHEYMYV